MNQNSERPIELVAIINSFNRRSLLERALGLLTEARRSARFPSAVIVFEAGSNDGSSEFLNAWRENHSGENFFVIKASPDRRSFSDGVNIGCAEAIARFPQCRWLLLYETDNCLTNPEPLEKGMSLLKREAQLAAAGFTVKQHDGKFYGYGMRFPTALSFVLGQNLAARLNLHAPNNSAWHLSDGIRWRTCDVVFTSPVLVRREAWEQSGGLDAANFPFCDTDLDWAWRCAKLGWKMAIIASVSKMLAEEFATAGNEVHVITQTPGDHVREANYRVSRRPPIAKLIGLLRCTDLFFQNNISLRSLLPALVLRKPTLVVYQTWLKNARGGVGWNNRIKRAVLRSVTNVAISKAVADSISGHSFVIGNPYDERVFRLIPSVTRDRDFVFVGRLVSDKGADLLLHAFKLLQNDNLLPNLTIIGTGPEEQNLRRLATELALDRQVTFAGQRSGAALAKILNRHRVLVVPSRWAEPFGIVALEGIACGCVVVGSEKGGLKEAIGQCGLTFENENVPALAEQLKRLLSDLNLQTSLRQHAAEHLAKFQADAVASAYLRLMRKMLA